MKSNKVTLQGDGHKITGVFCGDTFCYLANPSDDTSALRAAMNFYVPADDTMKIMDGGILWFRYLKKISKSYELCCWVFEIERHLDIDNARTVLTFKPVKRIDDELKAKITQHKLHDLTGLMGAEVREE